MRGGVFLVCVHIAEGTFFCFVLIYLIHSCDCLFEERELNASPFVSFFLLRDV